MITLTGAMARGEMIDPMLARRRNNHLSAERVGSRPLQRSSPRYESRGTLRSNRETSDVRLHQADYAQPRLAPTNSADSRRVDSVDSKAINGIGSWPPAPTVTPKKDTSESVASIENPTAQSVPEPKIEAETEPSVQLRPKPVSEASLLPAKEKKWSGLKRLSWNIGGAFIAMLILSATGYVSIDTWVTNNEVKTVVAERQQRSFDDISLGEGEDEDEIKPSVIDSYAVAGDMPRVLEIKKLGVKSRILPVGVNKDGSIGAPINVNDSGWYNSSAKPGQDGVSFVNAHASGMTRHGLFAYLDTLVAGDIIAVERGDGEVVSYNVTASEEQLIEDIDMREVLKSRSGGHEIVLMTCSGNWLKDDQTYDKRVIVYAEEV